MERAIGAIYVRKHSEISKQDILAMADELRDSFRIILKESDWLGQPTRNLAVLKLNTMNLGIGYPDYILDQKGLDKSYEDLDIHPGRYFENTLNVREYYQWREFLLTQHRPSWSKAVVDVNAYYLLCR